MARKPDRKDLNGIVAINKPSGITSHDVVDCVRRKFSMRRIGHAGTLDPLATGVLVILVGQGTKLFDKFVGFDKGYRATLILGTKTTSADTQGEVIEEKPWADVTEQQVRDMFETFLGEGEQIPPMVSAVRVNGQRLYKLARQGIEVKREPRLIRIDKIEMLRFEPPHVEFLLECSKGTYVRKFAEDVGDKLGCGACISQIERTKVGSFSLDEAIILDELTEDCVKEFSATAKV